MSSRYKSLPKNADYIEIARICRQCLRQMRKEKISYDQIIQRISSFAKIERGTPVVLTLASLKTFVSRDSVKRLNSNNLTIELIYNYLTGRLDSLSPEIRAIIMSEWHIFRPSSADSIEETNSLSSQSTLQAISALFCKWIEVPDKEINRIQNKFSGRYIMLRRSIHNSDTIIRSTIIFGIEKEGGFIKMSHIHKDRANVDRISKGFVVPVVRNIYCLMNIENGEGIEIFALKEPIQQNFFTILGFHLSMNIDRKLISSRVFLERESTKWESVPARFYLSELPTDDPTYSLVIQRIHLLDEVQSLTLPDISL